MQLRFAVSTLLTLCACATLLPRASAQTTAATFGEIVQLGGTPGDIVLDESRGRLYLINTNANRVDVYDYLQKQVLGSIPVGQTPLAGAMSMDNALLFVTNSASSTLSVIDLATGIGTLSRTVNLPAKPEGVEVGFDGTVLICTDGSGTTSTANTLLRYDSNQTSGQQVTAVQFPPPPTTPTTLGSVTARVTTYFRGKLQRTPDGKRIIGVSVINNSASTVAYVYEVASGVLLQSRIVTGQATTLSMAPDGSKFIAGFTMIETATLEVLAQASNVTAPFTMSSNFTVNTTVVGGSTFSPDGQTLYGAFNAAAVTTPAQRPLASTLLIQDPSNMGIKLGINLPESVVAKIAITADGSNAWAMSESGLLYLPLSTLYDYPILMPEATNVFLARDDCNRGVASASIKINNLGKGKLTFAVPSTISGGSPAVTVLAESGLAPSTITVTMDPGRATVTRQPGTNLYSGSVGNNGTAVNLVLASNEAINVPPVIRIYMNYRQSDQRGQIFPIATVPNSNAEGLQDIVLDESRKRIYISNSGYNRIEVFDTDAQKLLAPIPVGPQPHQLAMGLDGTTLYVGHVGSEVVGLVDLDAATYIGKVDYPPIPVAVAQGLIYPRTLAMGYSGLQIMMSNGTLWKVIGNTATPRAASQVINNNTSTTQTAIASPTTSQMIAANDYSSILLLNGNGTAYLYDALADNYTASRVLFTAPITGYYGPLAIADRKGYFVANGLVTNGSLTPIAGATTASATTGTRNVAAVAPLDSTTFVRMTTPVRTSLTATTRDDSRTTLESFNVTTGASTLVGVMPENPIFEVFGSSRQAMPPRQMVVDSKGTVYAITLSGLSVMPVTAATAATRPALSATQPIVNSTDGTTTFRPGSFITISGTNLASAATADSLPVPTVLGGSCVVFNDIPLPLLRTSSGQIAAQIPATVRSGFNVVQVRSLMMAQQSDPVVVTVAK